MVRYGFFLGDSFAITVEPFVVLDEHSGNEHGARIQVRRVRGGPDEAATTLGEPVWRGDLFRLTAARPATGPSPLPPSVRRVAGGLWHTDPALSKDPISWPRCS